MDLRTSNDQAQDLPPAYSKKEPTTVLPSDRIFESKPISPVSKEEPVIKPGGGQTVYYPTSEPTLMTATEEKLTSPTPVPSAEHRVALIQGLPVDLTTGEVIPAEGGIFEKSGLEIQASLKEQQSRYPTINVGLENDQLVDISTHNVLTEEQVVAYGIDVNALKAQLLEGNLEGSPAPRPDINPIQNFANTIVSALERQSSTLVKNPTFKAVSDVALIAGLIVVAPEVLPITALTILTGMGVGVGISEGISLATTGRPLPLEQIPEVALQSTILSVLGVGVLSGVAKVGSLASVALLANVQTATTVGTKLTKVGINALLGGGASYVLSGGDTKSAIEGAIVSGGVSLGIETVSSVVSKAAPYVKQFLAEHSDWYRGKMINQALNEEQVNTLIGADDDFKVLTKGGRISVSGKEELVAPEANFLSKVQKSVATEGTKKLSDYSDKVFSYIENTKKGYDKTTTILLQEMTRPEFLQTSETVAIQDVLPSVIGTQALKSLSKLPNVVQSQEIVPTPTQFLTPSQKKRLEKLYSEEYIVYSGTDTPVSPTNVSKIERIISGLVDLAKTTKTPSITVDLTTNVIKSDSYLKDLSKSVTKQLSKLDTIQSSNLKLITGTSPTQSQTLKTIQSQTLKTQQIEAQAQNQKQAQKQLQNLKQIQKTIQGQIAKPLYMQEQKAKNLVKTKKYGSGSWFKRAYPVLEPEQVIKLGSKTSKRDLKALKKFAKGNSVG